MRFWLHGGAFKSGAITDPTFNGCNVATDAIVVLAAYRLGPLGFISLPSAGIAGNTGVQDVQVALNWVQDNVEVFGGDPVGFFVNYMTKSHPDNSPTTSEKFSYTANRLAAALLGF